MTSLLDSFRMDGQVAFVNGGGRGIGAACAAALAEAGADVVIRAKTPSELQQTERTLLDFGHRVLAIEVGDDDEPDAAVRAIETAVDELGPITTLVNVAGGAKSGPFLSTTDEQLRDAFEFNVALPMRLCRAAVPHMLAAGGGSIVNISTAMAHLVSRGFVTYGTVKAALQHATRLMAADLSPKIRVNAVAPGAIMTDALRAFIDRNSDRGIDFTANVPMRRLGQPIDIAAAVLFLCSPAASYVTGVVIDVDGGIQVPAVGMDIADLE